MKTTTFLSSNPQKSRINCTKMEDKTTTMKVLEMKKLQAERASKTPLSKTSKVVSKLDLTNFKPFQQEGIMH